MLTILRTFLAAVLASVVVLLLTHPAPAAQNAFAINVDGEGRAIGGYDVVAYFTDAKAVKGSPDHVHVWKGARWQFTSAGHRDSFAADPERYAPRVGGFCATGVAGGRMVDVDPEAWLVVRGRLYLYLNADIRQAALEDLEAQVAAAEKNWQERPDKQ